MIVPDSNKEMSNLILERWAEVLSARRGDAVISPSGESLRTWADIENEAVRFQIRFAQGEGCVALQTGNHPSFPALLLACLRAGRAVALFDTGFFGEARTEIEQQLGVTLRVVEERGGVGFEECQTNTVAITGEGCVYKVTSGTTARPRAIAFTAEQLVADCDQVCQTMGIRADDLNFGVVSFSHSYGFSNLITPLICRGVRLVAASDALPRAIERALGLTGATVLPAVPAMFRGLLSADSLPDSLRLCIVAGAPLDPVLAREFREKLGQKIHAFYGASECGGICYDASGELIESAGFVGQPLQGVSVEMSDDPGGAKILVRSAAIGIGMRNATGGFEPPDLLVRESNGFRIAGRESDFINVAGRKVNPLEIEQVLVRFSGVWEAVVCGVEDPSRGEEICVLIAAVTPLDASSLRRHCAARVASWKVPRRFRFVSEIPRNDRGKISRAEIARDYFLKGK